METDPSWQQGSGHPHVCFPHSALFPACTQQLVSECHEQLWSQEIFRKVRIRGRAKGASGSAPRQSPHSLPHVEQAEQLDVP